MLDECFLSGRTDSDHIIILEGHMFIGKLHRTLLSLLLAMTCIQPLTTAAEEEIADETSADPEVTEVLTFGLEEPTEDLSEEEITEDVETEENVQDLAEETQDLVLPDPSEDVPEEEELIAEDTEAEEDSEEAVAEEITEEEIALYEEPSDTETPELRDTEPICQNGSCSVSFEFSGNEYLFDDEEQEITVHFVIPEELVEGEDYDLAIQAGFTMDREDWFDPDAEDPAYSRNGNVIVLHGKRILELAGEEHDHIEIAAAIGDRQFGEFPVFETVSFRLKRNFEDYDREYDRDMLVGWTSTVNGKYGAYVENDRFPDGIDIDYEVNNVTSSDDSVVKVERREDDENIWWDYRAVGYGSAVLEVSYSGVYGDELSYTFNVNVSQDVYEVHISSDSGSYFVLPGETLSLHADAGHHSENGYSEDGFLFEWEIVEGNAVIMQDGVEPNKALLVFRELEEGEGYAEEHVIVRVRLFDGTDTSGNPVERTSETAHFLMRSVYSEVWPAEIPRHMDIGTDLNITAEVRLFNVDAEEYEVLDDVNYRWYYDPNALEILDGNGETVGNNNEQGEYNDSPASHGSQVPFTIRRLQNRNTGFTLIADWGEGDEYHEERRDYWLDEKNYDIWFETDNDFLYSDETKTILLNLENLSEVDYEIGVFGIGFWNEDEFIDLNEDGSSCVLLEEVQEGIQITLNGGAIYDRTSQYDVYEMFLHVDAGMPEHGTWLTGTDLRLNIREAFEEYETEQDRDLMIGWTGTVFQKYNARVENAEYPFGEDFDYFVTDVRITEGTSVELEKKYNEEDVNDYWWDYRAVDYGDSVLEVTYTDLHGETKTYQFTLHVKTDVYGVDIFTEDGSFFALPGETLYLHAEAWHESETDGSTDSVTYQWEIAWGNGAVLTADESDSSHATLKFRDMYEDEDYAEEHIQIRVIVFDGTDEQGQPVIQAANEAHFVMRSEYAEIWPAELSRDFPVGVNQQVHVEVRQYSSGTDGFSIKENVHYRWYYDSNAIEVRDRYNKVVGNNNAQGEYIDSQGSYGSGMPFRITRKENWGTRIFLIAEWTEYGEHREERKEYWFDENDYHIWFETDNDFLYSDETKMILLNLENLQNQTYGFSVFNIGYFDGDTFVDLRNDSNCVRIQQMQNKRRIVLNGQAIYEKMSEAGTNDLYLQVETSVSGTGIKLSETELHLDVREAFEEYETEQDRDLMIGWTGTVFQKYNARVENAEYPFGEDFDYFVTDVRITEGTSVELEKKYNEEDVNDYWWDYRAVDYGDSVLEVTYTDLHGETKTYQFTLHVKTDVYGVDIFTEDGSFFALPGETLYLHAEAWHESETDGSTDSVTYQWEIAWGGGAELTPDSEDPSRAYLTFRNLEEGEEWAEEHVQVRVCIFDGEDEHGEPAEQSRNEAHFVMRSEYAEIWPAENNTLLGPGETEVINAHVRNYIGDPESYEIQPDVHYRWYYDSNIIEVYDRDGMLVGNNNASGEYIDSEASYGAETEFTILKKENVHTMVTLIAEWEVGRGEYRQERKDYWYHEADLSLKEIGLSEPSITIGVGEAYTLNVIYVPENTTDDRSVEWISSDSRIVSVHDGTVRGISSGTAVVIAKVGVFTASCTVTVGKKAEEILLNTYDATLNRGDSFQLTAEIIPEDVTNKKVYWSSSTPETATVDDHGLVRAIAPGVAEITVVSEDNPEAYTTCKILVQFTDVTDPSLFYYDYIYSMVEKGITTGYPDGTFRPTADCNRAAVVTFLWRLKGKPEPTQMATFKDMTGNSDFDKAISWAAENNITTGWTDNTFRPWNTCNRAAVMTFLWRAAGKPAPNKMAEFKDMTGNSDFDTAISWASEKGITTGWADNTFRPWNTCNRLAIASFLGRYAALEETIIETNR